MWTDRQCIICFVAWYEHTGKAAIENALTIDERGLKIATRDSVFDWQMAIENSVSNDF